jgi:hypothetical protein
MSEKVEPNTTDLLASKLGMHSVLGRQFAQQMLLTLLLETLRHKGILTENEIQTLIDTSSASLSESFDNEARDNPSAAEYIGEIKTTAEDSITWTRRELAKASSD